MTCRSPLAGAVHEVTTNPIRAMATIQSTIGTFFESHHVSRTGWVVDPCPGQPVRYVCNDYGLGTIDHQLRIHNPPFH